MSVGSTPMQFGTCRAQPLARSFAAPKGVLLVNSYSAMLLLLLKPRAIRLNFAVKLLYEMSFSGADNLSKRVRTDFRLLLSNSTS